MIIGIDISRANRKQKTGVEWYVYFLIQELKQIAPPEVRFRLYSDSPVTGELAVLPKNWEIKVLRWPPKRLWTQLRLSIEMLFHAPDVLFIPAHVPPIIRPKKIVMTIHDIAALRYEGSYSAFERWYSLASAKKAMTSLWKIITPSKFTKHELFSAFGSDREDSVVVVPHGYDPAFHIVSPDARAAAAKTYGLSQSFLMSVGRLESKKNTARIIDAFHELKKSEEPELQNLQLLLVGKPGYGYEHVKAAIEESPYKHDIINPGWVEQKDIPALMGAASAFVFPSLYEGFGLPILEAMACGTPVVTTVGHAAQEVGGRAAIYVSPESVEDIAHALRRLLLDQEFCKEQIALGLAQVKPFSWEKSAQETLQVLLSS